MTYNCIPLCAQIKKKKSKFLSKGGGVVCVTFKVGKVMMVILKA